MNAMRRYLPVMAAALAGCGDDFFDVRTKGLEPAPQVSAFHQTLGDPAINVSYLDDAPVDSSGDFAVMFSDGSQWSGNVNLGSGAFDVLLELPAGYFLVSVRDAGTLVLNESQRVTGAEWLQTRTYVDGSRVEWEMRFTIAGSKMDFHARNLADGTLVDGTVTETFAKLAIDETWRLENEYRDEVSTSYYNFGDAFVDQDWTRNEIGTNSNPDREGTFLLRSDFSGYGRLTWHYDHGIEARYDITQDSNGAATYTLSYDDPATSFVDGQGVYQLDASYNGTGYYDESYEDGSSLENDYVFFFDGSTDSTFRFEDPSTPASPDVDGDTHYEPDGSGDGSWQRYDAAGGVAESCQYTFDSGGSITSLACT